MDQHKLELHTEIDHLVDENSLNYNEMANVCLKIGTEKKLMNTTSPGMINECAYVHSYSVYIVYTIDMVITESL